MKQRVRNLTTPLFLVLGSLLVCFVLAEASIRILVRYNVGVNYLAYAGLEQVPAVYRSLEEFLQSKQGHIVPSRRWANYWANEIGMYDVEFVPKPAKRTRILALGDSFCYGQVSYPDNVLTLVEEDVRNACHGSDVDLLNFCIPASGVRDYRMTARFAGERYAPDIVLVHFYMGNDGPDLLNWWSDIPQPSARTTNTNSLFWNFQRNAFKLLRATEDFPQTPRDEAPSDELHLIGAPRGGMPVGDAPRLLDSDPLLSQPHFSEAAFFGVTMAELGHLYTPVLEKKRADRLWKRTLQELSALHEGVTQKGQRFIMVLYPSFLQVYPASLKKAIQQAAQSEEYGHIKPENVDPRLPNTILAEFCRTENILCVDLTEPMQQEAAKLKARLYIPGDTHWNVLGNRVAASIEGTYLSKALCAQAVTADP